MEEGSIQKLGGTDVPLHREAPAKEQPSEEQTTDGARREHRGWRWPVWLLVLLILLLFASSIANLVVSQRAYESSRKQVQAIEHLTQSIRDIQRSIADLSKMMEQPLLEDEEPAEKGAPAGDGSI